MSAASSVSLEPSWGKRSDLVATGVVLFQVEMRTSPNCPLPMIGLQEMKTVKP
jgi:hypothetical protein